MLRRLQVRGEEALGVVEVVLHERVQIVRVVSHVQVLGVTSVASVVLYMYSQRKLRLD